MDTLNIYYDKIDSTNSEAKNILLNNKIKKAVIIAQEQTSGKGRYGNKWIYMKNNLFMSVFFNLSSSMNLRKLTITSCKIVKKSLFKILKIKITIRIICLMDSFI